MRRLYMPSGVAPSAAPKVDLLTPGIQVEIYSQKYGRLGPGSALAVDPTDSLISARIEKSLASNTSTCVLTMTAGIFGLGANDTWAGLLFPMDFITVHVSRSEETPRCVFMGFIESVQISYAAPTAQAQRLVTIQAADLGSELASVGLFIPNTNVKGLESSDSAVETQWRTLWLQLTKSTVAPSTIGPQGSWLSAFLAFLGKKTAAAATLDLATLIQLFFREVLPLFFSPTVNLSSAQVLGTYNYEDFYTLALGDASEFDAAAFQVAPPDGTFWNTLRSFCNPPLFELFTDVRSADEQAEIFTVIGPQPGAQIWQAGSNVAPTFGPDQASYYLVFRPTPFYAERWTLLTQHKIEARDIVTYQLGRDRTQVSNYFAVYAEGWMTTLEKTAMQKIWPALADINSILQFGIAPMYLRLYGLTDFKTIPIDYASPYAWALDDWYIRNPNYIRGNITVTGDPKYRIGQRAYLPDLQTEGYIESVIHDFVVFSHYNTTLQLSRGEEPGTQPSAVARTSLSIPDLNAIQYARSLYNGIIDNVGGPGPNSLVQ